MSSSHHSILVGAPLGRYPGGLELKLNASVCLLINSSLDLSSLTEAEIRGCYLRTGLVYQCPLVGDTACGPVFGNMNASGPDGAVFDRVGE